MTRKREDEIDYFNFDQEEFSTRMFHTMNSRSPKRSPDEIEKLPLIDKLRIKLKKTDIPLSVRDIKFGAKTMIPEGEY